METILFDCYQRFQKEYNGSAIKRFLRLPWTVIVLTLVAFIALIGAIVFPLIHAPLYAIISIFVEIGAVVWLYFYTDSYQINTAAKRISTYRTYYADAARWLKSVGFRVDPRSIETLKKRIDNQIAQKEIAREKRNSTIIHIFDVVLIPAFLVIFTNAIQTTTEAAEQLGVALQIFTISFSLGMFVYLFYSIISFHAKKKIELLKCFASDLQSILDTQFEDKLFDTAKEK